MEQTLQGVSFPKPAVNHEDDFAQCAVCYPRPWKQKGIALPWLGYGVGEGKNSMYQNAVFKRKRETGSLGSHNLATNREKFKLDFLRHDGHFNQDRLKKGPVCNFAKQYRPLQWPTNAKLKKESDSLEYTPANQLLQPGLPTCGVDCYQVRAEIFQKVEGLMAQKPEKLHIKARIRPNDPEMRGPLPPLQLEQQSFSVDAVCTVQSAPLAGGQEEESPPTRSYPSRAASKGHQAVQTVFTVHKKVQTVSAEPKQVQWAIHPMDSLSPKGPKLPNELRKQAEEKQDNNASPPKAPEPRGEVHAKESLLLYGDTVKAARAAKQSSAISPHLGSEKKVARGKHHLLLYQEAVEMAKEQRDLEKAREQRQDFWSVYEREIKRGKGMNVEVIEAESKGKRTADKETEGGPAEQVSLPVKIKLNAFLDEHLSLTTNSPASSSPRDRSGPSGEASIQKLQQKEEKETSPRGGALAGLQELRKIEAGDSWQSLVAMEQQLNPETSQPMSHVSPTELDCMKAAILSHNFYPRLVTSFIDQHKAGAPPEQVEKLEKIRSQVMESWRPGSPVGNPAQDEKIKKYQEILTKFEKELEKPFQDAMDFSWQMENYLDAISPSAGRSGGSSGSNNLKDFDDESDIEGGLK